MDTKRIIDSVAASFDIEIRTTEIARRGEDGAVKFSAEELPCLTVSDPDTDELIAGIYQWLAPLMSHRSMTLESMITICVIVARAVATDLVDG